MKKIKNWHEDAFFGIHYDIHAIKHDTELGRELSREHLVERWKDIKPDWVQCDCKGHPGYTSWPTETGSASPGIIKDSLKIHREATRSLGIKLGVHYSGVIDSRAVELHPDWAAVSSDGEKSKSSTCRLSPYLLELMIPQFMEILDKYQVDGFWIDGDNWAAKPCWCHRCRDEFTLKTGLKDIPEGPEHKNWWKWLEFHRGLFEKYVKTYTDAVHKKSPECLVCSNWMYTGRQPDPVNTPIDYISGDYTPDWGSARAALEARIIDSRQLPWDLMVWGCTKKVEDQYLLRERKPFIHLAQEVSEVLAMGGALMIYAKPQRSGWLNKWDHEIIKELSRFCGERKKFCFKSETVPQCAVLHLSDSFYRKNGPLFDYGDALMPIEGALNIMLETHLHTDILTEETAVSNMNRYKLIVLPEQEIISDNLKKNLLRYVKQGGTVLISGTNISRDYPDITGCEPDGNIIEKNIWLETQSETAEFSPDWQPVKTLKNTVSLDSVMKGPDPEKDKTEKIAVSRYKLGKGKVIAIHGPFFQAYGKAHYPSCRRYFSGLIENLNINFDINTDAPPWLEIILRKKDKKIMIHLINRGASETLSPNRTVIEQINPVKNIKVELNIPKKPDKISLEPDNTPLQWHFRDNKTTIHVPKIHIYNIIAIE